jgi:hypothetical protein
MVMTYDTPISNYSKHWLSEMREMESDLEEPTTPYPTLVSKAALLATAETGQQVLVAKVQGNSDGSENKVLGEQQ